MNINDKTIGELLDTLNRMYDAQDDLKEQINLLEEYIFYRSNREARNKKTYKKTYDKPYGLRRDYDK